MWPPSLTILGPFWRGLRQALCMVSECVLKSACCLAVSMRQCFLKSSTASSSYILPAPYFLMVPETWEIGIVYVFPLDLNILRSYSLHVGMFWVSGLIAISGK